MLLKFNSCSITLTLLVLFIFQCEFAECYKSEIEVTPAPVEEPTTKKSGFFGGIKNFFRGGSSTSTTVAPAISKSNVAPINRPSQPPAAQTPPPLIIPQVPLMPLGPRPDTPPSTPLSGSSRPQQPPNWPQPGPISTTTTTMRSADKPIFPQQPQTIRNTSPGSNQPQTQQQPNLPPGFTPYRPTRRPQPSGLDLSYGNAGGVAARHPQKGAGAGLVPLTSTTTTTTTTTAAPQRGTPMNLGGSTAVSTTPIPKVKEEFPPLPPPRKTSTGVKDTLPAMPTPKSAAGAPTRPPHTAWPAPSSPSAAPSSTIATPGRVAFVPHSPESSTTMRTGFSTTNAHSLASDAEIRTLTETLYTKESNSQLSLIRINIQGKTRSIDSTDEAPQPLLEVDPKALESPTIAKMRLLFNNYEIDTMTNEHVTPNERLEENDFLDGVMTTPVMRQAMLFLQNKGIVTPDPKVQRDMVKELWFTQYSRGSGKIGSSGFEHVFVNEVKNGTIIGLHNWVYFNQEEKSGRLDYKGYLKELDLGTKAKVVKMRFTHNGLNKPVNALFIGTSPELELALYTVCFKLRPDSTCPVSLGKSQFGIVTYSWRYRGKNLIGSAFPEI